MKKPSREAKRRAEELRRRRATNAATQLGRARWNGKTAAQIAENGRLNGIRSAIKRGRRLSPETLKVAIAAGIVVPFHCLPKMSA